MPHIKRRGKVKVTRKNKPIRKYKSKYVGDSSIQVNIDSYIASFYLICL